MDKDGSIIISEDDTDDQEVLTDVFAKLNYPNKIIFFADAEDALDFLNKKDTVPFLILSDINMPKLSGFELRRRLKTDAELRIKCIPYLFFQQRWTKRQLLMPIAFQFRVFL